MISRSTLSPLYAPQHTVRGIDPAGSVRFGLSCWLGLALLLTGGLSCSDEVQGADPAPKARQATPKAAPPKAAAPKKTAPAKAPAPTTSPAPAPVVIAPEGTTVAPSATSPAELYFPVDPLDWPYWRGPEMNGVSRETGLIDSWSPDGENVLWKSEAIGTRSTPIVMRGKLYTLCRHNPHTLEEAEKVVCVDAATGEKQWEHVFNVYLTDVPDTRVGWSAVVGDPTTDHVFALGVCGYFVCLKGSTGEVVWSRSLSEEFGLLTTYGGRTNFPIVFENLVIISGVTTGWADTARPAHRFLAFNKTNGEMAWYQTTKPFPEDTTYSAPVTGVIGGHAQLIVGAGDGIVYSFQPRTGKVIWTFPVSIRGINTPPVIAGEQVICGHSEENLDDTRMGALFAVNPGSIGKDSIAPEAWRNKEQFVGKCGPLVVDDRVYAIDDGGAMYICDLATGKLLGKTKIGTMGRASPVYGDGKIYIADATGKWFIFEPAEKGVKKIHQLRLDVEINGSPIISHGRVYLPTETAMYCLGKADTTPAATDRPALPTETPASEDTTPAQVVVTPYEALLRPGQTQPLSVSLYNSRGQFLSTVPPAAVTFTVQGAGKVEGGLYSVPAGPKPAIAMITAKVGELTGKARLRVVPEFPWSIGFDGGQMPPTAIGLRARHIGLDFDLYQQLKAELPMAGRCYIYLMTQFINTDKPEQTFDDTTPAQAWTAFRRYLDVIEETNSQDEAKRLLGPALDILLREKILASVNWTGDEQVGTRLVVQRGPHEVTGNGVLCKITTITKGTRSQSWLGHPGSQNYTLQADVFAEGVPVGAGVDPHAKMPDIGLLNQRYRFEMMGASQQLKLYSWIPHDQKFKDLPFPWQTNTWYTMKLMVSVADQEGVPVATVRGKAWPRDKAEPADWSIEWTDQPANLIGSPGLSGNAKDAEIFFDNLKVTPTETSTP